METKDSYDAPVLTALGAFIEKTGGGPEVNFQEIIYPWDDYWV